MADLAKLLGDEQLASWSRIALEAIPGEAADESLRKAAGSLKGKLLVGVINSIGVRRDAGAVELLVGAIGGKDADVASAAAVALGKIGNAAAAKSLRPKLAGASLVFASAVAEGCILCAERFWPTETGLKRRRSMTKFAKRKFLASECWRRLGEQFSPAARKEFRCSWSNSARQTKSCLRCLSAPPASFRGVM